MEGNARDVDLLEEKIRKLQDENAALREENAQVHNKLEEYESEGVCAEALKKIDARRGEASRVAFDAMCKLPTHSERAAVLSAVAVLLGLNPDNLDERLE